MFRLEFAEKQSTTLTLAATLLATPCWAATEFNFIEEPIDGGFDSRVFDSSGVHNVSESAVRLNEATPSKHRLINFSKICIDSALQTKATSRERIRTFDTADLSQIEQMATGSDLETLLLNTREHRFAQQLSPVNKLSLHPLDIYQQHNDQQRFIHGGSALGAMLRMSMKSWWKNNQDSTLHKVSARAPESIRTGKISGKSRYDWDYSFKLSYDDVKFKLEKEF